MVYMVDDNFVIVDNNYLTHNCSNELDTFYCHYYCYYL